MSKQADDPDATTPDGAQPRTSTNDGDVYARAALRHNGISLSNEDLALTAAEFSRALEIARPLLDFSLPDGINQAGVYRP